MIKRGVQLLLLTLMLSIATSVFAQETFHIKAEVSPTELNTRPVINVSNDKTLEFEEKYNTHAYSDIVISELLIIFLELVLLIFILLAYKEFEVMYYGKKQSIFQPSIVKKKKRTT